MSVMIDSHRTIGLFQYGVYFSCVHDCKSWQNAYIFTVDSEAEGAIACFEYTLKIITWTCYLCCDNGILDFSSLG